MNTLQNVSRYIARSKFAWALILAVVFGAVASFAIDQIAQEIWFALANFGIMGGYLYIFIFVAPYFKVSTNTKVAGTVFFLTCALTHFEMGLHALSKNGISIDDLTSAHMMVIHTVQVVSVWKFVLGLREATVLDEKEAH